MYFYCRKKWKLIIVRTRVTLEWIFQKLKFRKVSIERGKSLIVKSNDRTRSKLISLNKIFFKLSKQPNDVSKHSVRNLRVRTALIKFNLPSEQKSVIPPLYNYLIVRIDCAIYDYDRLRAYFLRMTVHLGYIRKLVFASMHLKFCWNTRAKLNRTLSPLAPTICSLDNKR